MRVPDSLMSTAGKMRRFASWRSSLSSMLPVPLNSSKITSSIREPVSTSAVARMVSEPPSSMLRAAPKNFFGGYSAAESTPPERMRPLAGADEVVGATQLGDRVEEDDDVVADLDEALGPLDGELGDGRVVLGRAVEGRGDDLALDGPLHVGDLFGTLVDEDDHEVALGVVRRDRVGERLHDHRLAGLGRGDDQPALALADGGDEVDDPRGEQALLGLQPQPVLRVERGQLAELGAAAGVLGRHAVDRVELGQRGVLRPVVAPAHGLLLPVVALTGGLDRPGDGVALAQAVTLDHRQRVRRRRCCPGR